MTGNKHQPQQIVANIVIEGRIEVRRRQLALRHLTSQLFMLTVEHLFTPQQIESAIFCGCHEPCAGIFRNA
jgi:hypothetical protein